MQLDSIEVSYRVIVHGGRIQKLEPRAYGKTTRTTQEAIWAVLYDYRSFVGIVGSSVEKASEIMEGIKLELETNDVLYAMFPEVCYPIRCLEGKQQKARSQHIDGVPTKSEWRTGMIVLPTVAGSAASGNTIGVRPIKNVRGLQRRTKTKGVLRPDLWMLDDVQTDEDAANQDRVKKLLRHIKKGILRGGSLAKSIALLNLATIIDTDDLPDTLSRDPSFVTVKYKMLTKRALFEEKFWLGDYAKTRQDFLEVPGDAIATLENQIKAHQAATELYRQNREFADAGAEVSWEWAYPWQDDSGLTISAIQHAYNILIDDGEEVFACECQNEPLRVVVDSSSPKANIKHLRESIIALPPRIVPADTVKLVSYADLHKNVFFYGVMSTDGKETPNRHLVYHATWPRQPKSFFRLDNAPNKIPDMFPGVTNEKELMKKALRQFIPELAAMRWTLQGENKPVQLDEMRFDANGNLAIEICDVLSELATLSYPNLVACIGRYVGPKDKPMQLWSRKPGQTLGPGFVRTRSTARAVQQLMVDVNQWKTETHYAMKADKDHNGTMTFHDGSGPEMKLLFRHALQEKCKQVTKRRTIWEWTNPDGQNMNHYFDVLVNASVDDWNQSQKKNKTNTNKPRFSYGASC